jgi:hypothetical protein
MAQTTRELTVGDVEYEIYHFGAIEGLKIGGELAKKLAPVIAPMVEMSKAEGLTASLAEKVAAAIVEIDTEDAVALVLRLFANTSAKGAGLLAKGKFDLHFAGRLADIVPVLAAIVEHNFADFFSGVLERMPATPAVPVTAPPLTA